MGHIRQYFSIFSVIVFLLINSSLPGEEKIITVQKSRGTPVIDGKIEKLWGNPAVSPLIVALPSSKAGEIPDNKTSVYLLYDAKYLYLAFECAEADMKNLVTDRMKERDGAWGDDGIEIFLQPDRTKPSFYQFYINAQGIVADIKYSLKGHGNKSWDSDIFVKTDKAEKGWTAEMRIPWADFAADNGITGIWGINLTRWEPRKSIGQSWAPITESFGEPDMFKKLKFEISPKNYSCRLSDFSPGALSYGDNIASAKIKNEGEKPSLVVAEIKWQIFGSKSRSRLGKPYLLKPGETKTLSLNYFIPEKKGKGKIIFRILNPGDKFCYLQKVEYFDIPSSFLTLQMEPVYYLFETQANLEININLGENTRKKTRLLITLPSTKKDMVMLSPAGKSNVPIDISEAGLGEHTISVKLFDAANNLLETKEITFKNLKQPF